MKPICPFCGNDDPNLVEMTNRLTSGGLVVYVCHVCLREFEWDEP